MRDVFYTILVVWIVWRILNSISGYKAKHTENSQQTTRKDGETTVDYVPPTKKKISDDEGDYVDYEEIK